MSRSRRKTPIVGHTTCGSEREDKKLWHQRWRTRERTALTSASPEALSAHLPLLENQASSVWSMGKDGRSYWPVKRQAATADRIANHKGRNPQERASLKKRLLRKWMSKWSSPSISTLRCSGWSVLRASSRPWSRTPSGPMPAPSWRGVSRSWRWWSSSPLCCCAVHHSGAGMAGRMRCRSGSARRLPSAACAATTRPLSMTATCPAWCPTCGASSGRSAGWWLWPPYCLPTPDGQPSMPWWSSRPGIR